MSAAVVSPHAADDAPDVDAAAAAFDLPATAFDPQPSTSAAPAPRTADRAAPKAREGDAALVTIRKRCLDRIKKDRAAQQSRRRYGGNGGDGARHHSRARAILDDVLKGIKRGRDDDEDADADDGARAAPPRSSGADDAVQEELMTSDEEALLVLELEAELREAEREAADAYDHDLAMEALNVEAAGLAFDADEACGAGVLCPVCSTGYLLEGMDGGIACSHCDVALPDHFDGLTLDDVRERLERTFAAHAARCSARPTFSVDAMTGIPMLACRCAACGYFEIVV